MARPAAAAAVPARAATAGAVRPTRAATAGAVRPTRRPGVARQAGLARRAYAATVLRGGWPAPSRANPFRGSGGW